MTPVLIIGGGIAGVATALALQKAGLEATVYEAHPHSSQDGGLPDAGQQRDARPPADQRP